MRSYRFRCAGIWVYLDADQLEEGRIVSADKTPLPGCQQSKEPGRITDADAFARLRRVVLRIARHEAIHAGAHRRFDERRVIAIGQKGGHERGHNALRVFPQEFEDHIQIGGLQAKARAPRHFLVLQ